MDGPRIHITKRSCLFDTLFIHITPKDIFSVTFSAYKITQRTGNLGFNEQNVHDVDLFKAEVETF